MKQKKGESGEMPKWWQFRREVVKKAKKRWRGKRKMINLCLAIAVCHYNQRILNFHWPMIDTYATFNLVENMYSKKEKKTMNDFSQAYKKGELWLYNEEKVSLKLISR